MAQQNVKALSDIDWGSSGAVTLWLVCPSETRKKAVRLSSAPPQIIVLFHVWAVRIVAIALGCKPSTFGLQGFESLTSHHSSLVQWTEHIPAKDETLVRPQNELPVKY